MSEETSWLGPVVGIGIAAAVVIGIIVAFLCKRKGGDSSLYPTIIKKTTLSMQEVVEFFQAPERLAQLKQNQDYIAVAIKEKTEDGTYQIVLCCFNKAEGKLVNPEENAVVYKVQALDEVLERQFNGKDMIVLQ